MSVLKTWISLVVLLSLVLIGCGKEPSCTDGIQNQGETGIDCCAVGTTCDICPVCVLNPEDSMSTDTMSMDTMTTTDDPLITAKVNGDDWTSTVVATEVLGGSTLKILGSGDNGATLQLTYSQAFEPGTYDYVSNFFLYETGSMVSYQSDNSLGGSLVFSTFDTINNTVSGTFEFSAVNQADSTDVLQFTEGVFSNIAY